MLRDYYGRIVGLPTDHPDNEDSPDDGDLTACECVTGCEDYSDIEAILAEDDDEARLIEAFKPFRHAH